LEGDHYCSGILLGHSALAAGAEQSHGLPCLPCLPLPYICRPSVVTATLSSHHRVRPFSSPSARSERIVIRRNQSLLFWVYVGRAPGASGANSLSLVPVYQFIEVGTLVKDTGLIAHLTFRALEDGMVNGCADGECEVDLCAIPLRASEYGVCRWR